MANGITSEGFQRKRLDEILSDKNAAVQSVLGSNLNVSPESPDGQINGVLSESDANLWEIAEACYNAFSPSKSTGDSLSNLVQINGITREPASASTVELVMTGTNGTVIPIGSLVSASDESSIFTTTTEAVITLGVATAQAQANETGPISALAGTLTTIDSPITGWDTVDNLADAIEGQNEETDAELRARRELSVTKAAKAIVDTILAELLDVSGVTNAFVFENDNDSVDPITGTPARKFQCVVLGGSDIDVATAIFNEKPIGIGSFGSTTQPILDSQGIAHDINFTRPASIDIFVIVNLTTNSLYPADGDDIIKQNIVDYADGTLVVGRGFSVAEDVINSELYTPVNLVQGHTVDSILIGLSASPTSSNDIPIAFNQVSNFTLANIVVNS